MNNTVRREIIVGSIAVVILAAVLWRLGAQEDPETFELDTVMLNEQDVAALEADFEFVFTTAEMVDLPLSFSLPALLSQQLQVPTITSGWKETETGRRLVLIGYQAPLASAAAGIFEGHVGTVAPGATGDFDISEVANARGFTGFQEDGDTVNRTYRGTFQQGLLFIDIYLVAPDPDDERDIATVRRLAAAQSQKAPAGDSVPALSGGPSFAIRAVAWTFAILAVYLLATGLVAASRDPLRSRKLNGSAARPPDPEGQAGLVVDITSRADQARRRARRDTLIALLGVALVAPGLLPLSWPWGLVGLAAGAAILVGTRANPAESKNPDVRQEQSKPELNGARRRARVYNLVAVGCIAVGLAVLVLAGVGVVVTSVTDPYNIRFAVAGAILVAAGAALARYVRRLSAAAAAEAVANDPRPMVLFLRAFADDELRIRSARMGREGLFDRLDPRGFDRFEQVIARTLTEYGPVVAVNPPGTDLAPLGAARETLPPGDWKPQVEQRIRDAGWISIGAARGTDVDGLAWELTTIDRLDRWPSVLLILPPVPAERSRVLWDHFSQLTSRTAMGIRGFLPSDPARTLVLTGNPVDGWTALTADRRDEWSYAAALSAAIEMLRTAKANMEAE